MLVVSFICTLLYDDNIATPSLPTPGTCQSDAWARASSPCRTYADMAGPETFEKYKTPIYLAGSASAEFFADIGLCAFEAVKVWAVHAACMMRARRLKCSHPDRSCHVMRAADRSRRFAQAPQSARLKFSNHTMTRLLHALRR